jgi:hypothetical protein
LVRDAPEVRFQVADKKYRGTARIVAGADRARLFRMMAGLFPPLEHDRFRPKRPET